MKTLVVGNQKGGVGKTSILVHLAYELEERNKRVLVIDLDPQANASYSLKEYASSIKASDLFRADKLKLSSKSQPGIVLISADNGLSDLDKLDMIEACRLFKKTFEELKGNFDVCLIDTAPSLGVRLAAALIVANYVVCPIELEAYSIQGIQKMLITIGNIKKANPAIQFLGMVPSKVDSRNPRHNRHYEELLTAYPEYIIQAPIGLRSSVPDALANRMPVWKIKKTEARKAAKEFRTLSGFIFNKMEINHG